MKNQRPATTARARRAAISKACREWQQARAADPTNEEADIPLEDVLLVNNVLHMLDAVYEIYSDSPETLMLRVNGSTLIEIDVESGNSARGERDAD